MAAPDEPAPPSGPEPSGQGAEAPASAAAEEAPAPPPDLDRPPRATLFRLGPRAHWHPVLSSLFIAFVALVPAILLGFALRPVLHPMIGILLGTSLAVVAAVWPQVTVTVGVDGVSVGRRFFGYDDVAAIARGEDYSRGVVGLVIALENGERIDLHCMVPQRESILAAALDARARFMRSRRELDTAALRKRKRSASEWVRDLRALGAGARLDHRTPPVPPEALWQALESMGAAPGVRAAAAVALRETLDVDGRRRLLEIAETTASRRLRIALQVVAADRDDEALAEVLAAAEAGDEARAYSKSGLGA
jgi:hypothetical protein